MKPCWHLCCLSLSSLPHPLFIFDLFIKVSLLTTVLIKGFLLIMEPLWGNETPPTSFNLSIDWWNERMTYGAICLPRWLYWLWISLFNFFEILNPKMMVSSKPKHFNHSFIYLFALYNWFQWTFLHRLWEMCAKLRTFCQGSEQSAKKWWAQMDSKTRGEKTEAKRGREREINGLQGNVSEAERGKKDVYICSSMQSAHVCVWEPLVMYSRQQWWMRPFLQSPVLSLQGCLLAHCWRKLGGTRSLFTDAAATALTINL